MEIKFMILNSCSSLLSEVDEIYLIIHINYKNVFLIEMY